MKTICAICGDTYYRGDPESSTHHRAEHKRRMRYFAPAPHPKVLEAQKTSTDFGIVTSASPMWMHNEMYERARLFKREFSYDFVQWGSPKRDTDATVEGHLLINEAGAIVGVCAFRVRKDRGQSFRGLQFIWIAPTVRRSGILSRYWATFRKRYGAFLVESPVSPAMQGFLHKHNEAWLMDVDEVRNASHASDNNVSSTR